MILGIGVDMVDVRRMERLVNRHGPRLDGRFFTSNEVARAESSPQLRMMRYAKLFAVKEAVAKALGTGFGHEGVRWQDMELNHNTYGAPNITLTGGAKAWLARLTPTGYRSHIHISLTDTWPLAQAFVTIDAVPA